MAWIKQKNTDLSTARKSRSREIVERDIKQMLTKRKLKSLMNVTVTPIELEVVKKDGKTRTVHSFQLSAEIDQAKEKEIRRLDGMTCFITNDKTISPAQVIQKYREKNKIEAVFREMKSQLALRPIHLTRPERVNAHVSVCIMAYLLINTMEMFLRKTGCSPSPKEVLNQSCSCQLNQVGFKSSSHWSITMTELTEQQQKWIKLFQCEKSLKPKGLNQLIQSLQNML